MSAKTKVLTKGHKQGSANRADFHIYGSVFHADHRGAHLFFIKIIVCRITVAWSFEKSDLEKKFIAFLFLNQIERDFQYWIAHEKLYK